MSRVFPNGLGDQGSITGQVISKTQKNGIDATCFALSIIK